VSFAYVSGRPCLDFAGTLKWRRREQSEEQLTGPTRLAEWARAGQFIQGSMPVTSTKLAKSIAVREAIYRLVTLRISGEPADPAALDKLNQAARHRPLTPQLINGQLRWHGSVDQLISTVARDALELLGSEQVNNVRECTGQECTRLFIDTSRGNNRRWCGMGECGNRAKVEAFRRRQHVEA
jgi:predicted RNA-binding Zn ribbon-like protein